MRSNFWYGHAKRARIGVLDEAADVIRGRLGSGASPPSGSLSSFGNPLPVGSGGVAYSGVPEVIAAANDTWLELDGASPS